MNTEPLVSVAEYRRLMKDDVSTDERIVERLRYLESFCRTIIRAELDAYSKQDER